MSYSNLSEQEKERRREYARRYYREHREQTLARLKADREANPEKYRERDGARDPEKLRASARAYHHAHPEERATANRAWQKANAERRAEYRKARRAIDREQARRRQAEHPDKHCEHQATRRARKAGAPVVEAIDRVAIIERDASTCYLCGKVCAPREIDLDHVIPLSRGGHHTAENLRVACAPCNRSKGTRLLEEMVAFLGN